MWGDVCVKMRGSLSKIVGSVRSETKNIQLMQYNVLSCHFFSFYINIHFIQKL